MASIILLDLNYKLKNMLYFTTYKKRQCWQCKTIDNNTKGKEGARSITRYPLARLGLWKSYACDIWLPLNLLSNAIGASGPTSIAIAAAPLVGLVGSSA